MIEWQPIKTAPRETMIMLANPRGVWIGRYAARYQSGYAPSNPWFSYMLNHKYMGNNYALPTHWAPLPEPPQ